MNFDRYEPPTIYENTKFKSPLYILCYEYDIYCHTFKNYLNKYHLTLRMKVIRKSLMTMISRKDQLCKMQVVGKY